MGTCLGFVQIIPGPPGDNILLMINIPRQDLLDIHHLGLFLIIDQGKHDHTKSILQLGMLEEIIQYDIRIDFLFDLNDNGHAIAVRLIPDVGYPRHPFFLDQVGNLFNQPCLIDLVGNLMHQYTGPVIGHFLDFGFCTDHNASPAGPIGLANPFFAQNQAACGKIGTFDILNNIIQIRIRMIHQGNGPVNHLSQIVRRNVGGHPHCNTGGTIDQQIRKSCRQHHRLLQGLIEIRHEINGFLPDIPQHFLRNLCHSCFRIAHGSRGIPIHGSKISMAVHQWIANGEILCKPYHGFINRTVPMGMIFAQHITDNPC